LPNNKIAKIGGMNNQRSARKKLMSFLGKKDQNLSEKELSSLLHNIVRFVKVVQKIYIEPQARIHLEEVEENGEIVKRKIINTNIEELMKIKRGDGQPITIETFRELTGKLLKKKYKMHGD